MGDAVKMPWRLGISAQKSPGGVWGRGAASLRVFPASPFGMAERAGERGRVFMGFPLLRSARRSGRSGRAGRGWGACGSPESGERAMEATVERGGEGAAMERCESGKGPTSGQRPSGVALRLPPESRGGQGSLTKSFLPRLQPFVFIRRP